MVNTEIRLIILFAAKEGETLYSQKKTRLGANCESDRSQTLYCQIQTSIEKSKETTRPFRYDLNQIP